MKLQDYIRQVCLENNLQDAALCLMQSNESSYYADRHVYQPPCHLGAKAACEAGVSLLVEWTRQASSFGQLGLVVSKPLLVVDQKWLDGALDSPLPHVLVAIARSCIDLPSDDLGASAIAVELTPLANYFSEVYENVFAYKVGPSEELESSGAWLFRLAE